MKKIFLFIIIAAALPLYSTGQSYRKIDSSFVMTSFAIRDSSNTLASRDANGKWVIKGDCEKILEILFTSWRYADSLKRKYYKPLNHE